MEKVTRGVRNNNPFNIKRTQTTWKGESPDVTDGTFEQFKSIFFGVRAGIKLLLNYVRNGYDTPTKIISRFAPASENDIANYLRFLLKEGYILSVDSVIYPATSDFFMLCAGICRFESNYKLSSSMYHDIVRYSL